MVLRAATRCARSRSRDATPGAVCSIVRPMHETTPRRLPDRPPLDRHRGDARLPGGRRRGVVAAAAPGARPAASANGGELLVEFGGRACYRSWEPGLNPNVTQGAHRPARVLRQHPALGPRQRAGARELLVRAAQRQPRFHPRACQPSRRLGVQPGEPALRAPRPTSAFACPRRWSRCASRCSRSSSSWRSSSSAPQASSGSTRRACRSTSRRRSPPRCAGSRRSACQHRHRLDGQRAHAAPRDRDAHRRGRRGGAATRVRRDRAHDAGRGARPVSGLSRGEDGAWVPGTTRCEDRATVLRLVTGLSERSNLQNSPR